MGGGKDGYCALMYFSAVQPGRSKARVTNAQSPYPGQVKSACLNQLPPQYTLMKEHKQVGYRHWNLHRTTVVQYQVSTYYQRPQYLRRLDSLFCPIVKLRSCHVGGQFPNSLCSPLRGPLRLIQSAAFQALPRSTTMRKVVGPLGLFHRQHAQMRRSQGEC